jgi:23S rRNA A2030 N6-methylase RlmJ
MSTRTDLSSKEKSWVNEMKKGMAVLMDKDKYKDSLDALRDVLDSINTGHEKQRVEQFKTAK